MKEDAKFLVEMLFRSAFAGLLVFMVMAALIGEYKAIVYPSFQFALALWLTAVFAVLMVRFVNWIMNL